MAIIPLLLFAGYFERYISMMPQYFSINQLYASNEYKPKQLGIEVESLKKISVSLIDTISQLNVPEGKVLSVKNYLSSRGAPLASEAKYLVQAAQYYNIDYRIVAAISIVESSGGKHTYRPYNAWGWGGSENAFTFKSWKQSITTVSSGISKYYAGGATTPALIAPRYNPHTPNEWSRKVAFVMEQM